MQDEIGDERLLERRREALDELRRQPADEADRVGDEVALAVVLEAARRRVERLEEPVLDADVRAGQRVQERRLADVRVAGERDGGRAAARALLAPRRAVLADLLEAPPQQRDLVARETAVGLELRLAGAARADAGAERTGAAAEALEVLPHAPHPRQVVLELRELDLELALGAPRVLGEDVEDQLRPVDDAGREGVLERSLLRRLQLAVHEQHLRLRLLVGVLQLLELPLADVRARIRARRAAARARRRAPRPRCARARGARRAPRRHPRTSGARPARARARARSPSSAPG